MYECQKDCHWCNVAKEAVARMTEREIEELLSTTEKMSRIRTLRDLTSLPLLECKNALIKAKWNLSNAHEILRQKHR